MKTNETVFSVAELIIHIMDQNKNSNQLGQQWRPGGEGATDLCHHLCHRPNAAWVHCGGGEFCPQTRGDHVRSTPLLEGAVPCLLVDTGLGETLYRIAL